MKILIVWHQGLLSSSGECFDLEYTLLDAGVVDGDTLTAVVLPAKVSATTKAFAMWSLWVANLEQIKLEPFGQEVSFFEP